MGRPINKRFFGASGIDVVYHNGSSAGAGHIVKQTGSKTFLCDGNTTEAECTLVTDAAANAAGEMSIAVPGAAGKFVAKISGHKIVDQDGTVYTWNGSGTGVDVDLTP
tara:strand:- start:1397 stop:1720 length:324 start_codon:yes stop_codon:yes gene_type:complete